VELLTALLYVAVIWHDGLTPALLFDLVFVSALVARVAIPYFTATAYFDDLPSLMNGILHGMPVWASSLVGALIGGLIGGGSLWLMGWTWEKLRGIEAMGLGDVKMMFMVGVYFGWRLTVLTIFLGVLSGSIIGIALMLRQGKRDMQMLLPFGVFLGIGAIVALLVGSHIVQWYAGQFR